MLAIKSVVLFLLILIISNSAIASYWGDNRTDNYSNGQFLNFSEDALLNEYFQASIHNAYNKNDKIYDILRNYGTNIEIDIFDSWTVGVPGVYLSGDWYVRHNPVYPGEDVRCITDGDHDYLSECLNEIMRFHNDYPNHDLITIWLDKKQSWQPSYQCSWGINNPCRRPGDLDSLLVSKIGNSVLFSPADMLAASSASNLRDAASQGDWPNMSELRGKIMVVITDASDSNNSNLSEYLSNRGNNAKSFVAPKMTSGSVDSPVGMGNNNKVVFYNLSSDKRYHGTEIYSKGRISRTWGVNLGDSSSSEYRGRMIQNGAGDDYTNPNRYTGPLLD